VYGAVIAGNTFRGYTKPVVLGQNALASRIGANARLDASGAVMSPSNLVTKLPGSQVVSRFTAWD
jgi:hypothetical protein